MRHKPAPYFLWWILLALLFCSLPAFAVTIEKPLPDQTQEARARHIFTELRCVVCEGQALADSDTELARQMRLKVRDMVSSGSDDNEVLDYFTEHYGASVRMSPPIKSRYVFIWLAPAFILLASIIILVHMTRRKPV